MFERFTERARQVVVLAQEEARTLKHNYIGTEHILLGLLREEEGLAARVLESLDITVERVRAQVVRIVGSGEEVTSGQIPFTPRAKKVLELALREAPEPRPQLHRHRAHSARPRARERGRRRPHPARLRRRLREDPQRGHPHALRPRRTPPGQGTSSPPADRELEGQIETARREKEAAIEAQEFEKAAALRDKERKLTNRRKCHAARASVPRLYRTRGFS